MVPFGASPGHESRIGFTMRFPLGVICAITPFNSPLNTVLHKVGPAFAAGNSVVLKPSALTPLTSALLCDLFSEAGVPPGFINLVQGQGRTVGNHLLNDQRIAFYAFTGSTEVGKLIQRAAGLRRTQMELGSIASTVVLADADLDRAIPKIANAAFRKAGQVCTSVQILLVERPAVDEVRERLLGEVAKMPAGNPRSPGARIGPMISETEARRAESWIEEASSQGAKLVCGGERQRSVLQPAIIEQVSPDMKVVNKEVFAPLVSIIAFDELEQAISAANDTPYGLSAGVFTRNIDRALVAAQSLRFGSIHLNEASSARADVMPFGGVKDSGFGHEGPSYAVREMTEERLITLNR
jgi:succinate-semialdehyde dehydrogenase/glutarate-semialdehyde dehydrogenase